MIERTCDGWMVSLPVRREQVTVRKHTVVYEEVDIRREYVEDVEPVRATVRHEELDIQPHGSVHVNDREAAPHSAR
ncbi:MAG: DUF2382 domain-containing protein [Chloroflexi bacterium]|nr:DUF2382 domain-containing protein [Chloroflexota bacterium]